MRITFAKKAPKGAVSVAATSESVTRLVRRGAADTLEVEGLKPTQEHPRALRLFARRIITSAKGQRLKRIAVSADLFRSKKIKLDDAALGKEVAVNMLMSAFEPNQHKSFPGKDAPELGECVIVGASAGFRKGGERGIIVAGEVNACRVLANTPGGDMTPRKLAEAAKKALKGTRARVKVFGKRELGKLGAGAILGVARGSEEEPQLIIIEYRAGGKKPPIALIGKGVTFDTGGLNLKPESGLYEMHMDMSGGAAVIHAIAAAAKLRAKVNVVGIIPAVENMPSGSAYHPGDILKSLSGKTIEVLNTDAEGRVILADGITYAKRYKPRLLVTVATLTGAVLTALGQQASGILTRDEKMEKLFRDAGEESGDYVWPLPLWDEYEEMVKGNFGDVANISTMGNSRYGGVISGAMFLWQFAKDIDAPFVHIDMASRMTAAPNEHLAKGAAGAPVRLLLRVLEMLEK